MTAESSGAEQKRTKARPRGRPFQKGVSGNPGGRPKEEREVVEAIRLKGGELVKTLLHLALKKKNLFAIIEALDRGYGKTKQTVSLEGANGGPVAVRIELLSPEQREQMEALLRAASETPKPE